MTALIKKKNQLGEVINKDKYHESFLHPAIFSDIYTTTIYPAMTIIFRDNTQQIGGAHEISRTLYLLTLHYLYTHLFVWGEIHCSIMFSSGRKLIFLVNYDI